MSGPAPDFYRALGLTSSATAEEIKRAYRLLAKEHHPDQGGDAETFRLIQQAYEVLSDQTRRAAYDRDYVDGAEMLDETCATLCEFVAFSSPDTAVACALYAAATYAAHRLQVATRLVIKSPTKQCGKSRLMEVMAELVNQPKKAGSISAAAMVRLIDEFDPPTFLLDENDVTFGRATDEKADYLRQVLNNGFSRGYPYSRYNASTREVEDCPTFAMVILAAIGNLPDTIEDRAVVIPMRRRSPNEKITRWHLRTHPAKVREVGKRLGEWALGRSQQIAEAWPALPEELSDRAQDAWEPLLAVADLAGGEWPAKARSAAVALSGGAVQAGRSVRLLADLRVIFGAADRLPTTVILNRLHGLEESPWRGGKSAEALNPYSLASLLEDYGITSKLMRFGPEFGSKPLRGYARAPLADAWARYLPEKDEGGSRQGERYKRYSVTPQVTASANNPVTEESVTEGKQPAADQGCNGVTDVTADPPQKGTSSRRGRPSVPIAEQEKIRRLRAEGLSVAEIARRTVLSEATVRKYLR